MTQSLRLARHQAANEGPGGSAAALLARLEGEMAAKLAAKGGGAGAAEGLARAVARRDNPGAAQLVAKIGVDPKGPARVAAAHAQSRSPLPKLARTAQDSAPGAPSHQRSPEYKIAFAAETARCVANARFATVVASPAAIGRARSCSILLSDARNLSAAEIVAQLPYLPDDRELARKDEIAAADAVWDRANAESAVRRGIPARQEANTAPMPPLSASDAVWDKAYGAAAKQSAQVKPATASKAGQRTSDDVWARAYGSAVQ